VLTGVFKLFQNIMYRQPDDAALKKRKGDFPDTYKAQGRAKMPVQQKQQQSPVA
jgi:hypothetical protein